MLKYLVFIGTFAQLVSIYIYVKDTIKWDTKPNKVTWLMWSIAPLIATFAAISDWVTLAVLPVFMCWFWPFLIFLSSFVNSKSYWEIEKGDYICWLFSLIALVLWWITKEPLLAIIFAIISDFTAAIPTLIKAYKEPDTESWISYLYWLAWVIFWAFAITSFKLSEFIFQLYLFIITFTIITIIYRSKIQQAFVFIKK